jgi:hypothetical protein
MLITMLSLAPACDNVPPMRSWGKTALPALVSGCALAACAMAAAAPPASARRTFKPRIAHAMGIEPKLGSGEIAAGPITQVVYHGGSVMRNVTLHTLFWAPPGYRFDGSPGTGVLGYEPLIKQFLLDVAHDSASPQNVFSTLTQYHDGRGAGSTHISYNPASDSVDLTAPYPTPVNRCASPSGVTVCVTDLEVEQAIDRVIGPGDPGARGLSNMWIVLLPPDVDQCTQPEECATNTYAGYHSEFDLGHGPTVYVMLPDPLVGFTPAPGSDPQGNPEAEASINTMAHEIEEAITDPIGTGWLDPTGFEVADKCESPEQGTPLGYAPDGSPYNQLIDGREYLIQDMWSNAASGCVQQSTATGSALPLHSVDLRQYSSSVQGRFGVARRLPVRIILDRGPAVVASAATSTRADGTWGPVRLRSARGAPHAVGDDRDTLVISYGNSRTAPAPDVITTGNGGNPFSQSGFTGWQMLDAGTEVFGREVMIAPCSQTGVISLRVGSSLTEPPAELCGTETDTATVPTPPIGPRTRVTLSSEDNRTASPVTPDGALVDLTVPLSEYGLPTCTAYLRTQSVTCGGLTPGNRYTLAHHRLRARGGGTVSLHGLHLRGGELFALSDSAGLHLTTLHVANLRVGVVGNQTQIASGTCQAGDYYGPASSSSPIDVLLGIGGTQQTELCPNSGHAHGLSSKVIAQIDDFSGGQTVLALPTIESTSPIQDETLYGSFVASAQTGLPGPHGSISATGAPVALTITRAASKRPVFTAHNVDTAGGVDVPALAPGTYTARWVLRDTNGDTRTLTTRFADEE